MSPERHHRKTGYRSGVENGGIATARIAAAVRSNRYLSLLERQRIVTRRGQGLGMGEDAAGLIVHPINDQPRVAAQYPSG